VSDPEEPGDRPEVGSRRGRLAAYVRHNGERMVVDVAILAAWVVASAAVFGWLGVPQWLHYLVLSLGVVAYARLTRTWERPYESPD